MAKKLDLTPMTLMVISAEADKIHMALMTGATAAAMGRPVSFFFSKGAIRFLTNDGWASLKASDGTEATFMDAALEDKGVADSSLLMDGLNALDVRFIACETALREYDIDQSDILLRPAVEISGLADIIEKGRGGDWLTF